MPATKVAYLFFWGGFFVVFLFWWVLELRVVEYESFFSVFRSVLTLTQVLSNA